MSPLPRRAISLSALAFGTLALYATAPILFIAGGLVDLVRGTSFVRALGFGLAVCALEAHGVLLIGLNWLKAQLQGPDHRSLYLLQRRWAMRMIGALQFTFDISFEVDGDPLPDGPLLLLPRHVSMADTVLPVAVVGAPHDRHPRYVLKAELQWDPCLDLVGNRLPNAFVKRYTGDAREVQKVAAMAHGLTSKDFVVLYPEGTRFETRVRDKLLADPRHTERAARFEGVLPPRAGGVLALLDGCDADVVLMAHHGLDEVTRVKDLVNGRLVGQVVRTRLMHVSRADIPDGDEARRAWLDEMWSRVDQATQELASSTASDH